MNVLGFHFYSPEGIQTVRVKLPFGVYDLIAKAQVLNMVQFNGYFGCSTCFHPGEHHGVQHVYPPGIYDMRTNASFQRAASEANCCGGTVQGIKGVSIFWTCRYDNRISM